MSRARRPAALRGDEEQLYRDHHRRLVSSVGWAVQADPALIEDACARAWEQLIHHQPQRTERIFAWLRTVAIREAWALRARSSARPAPGTTTRGSSPHAGRRRSTSTARSRPARRSRRWPPYLTANGAT